MPDAEVEIVKGCLVQPFEPAPASPIKRRVSDLMQKSWDGSVWHSARFYDAPGAIMTKMVEGFPYLGRPDKSFSLLTDLDGKTKALLAFLQASVTRQPLVGASWFCYEDEDLDFNSHENHLSWCVPEVEPIVRRNVPVKADHLAGTAAALARLPEDWRDKLVRSTERFVLSQCRYQPVDRALDLAIAFEILTTGGKGDNAPPNWKVSVRSAQLIGGPLARRQHIRDLLGALYKIRNTGSHGGSLKASEATEQDAVLGECGTIYQSLVDDVLAIGTGPVWSDLELEPRTRE